MSKRELETTAEVMEALGGINAVAEITGQKYKAAANWKAFEAFPSRTYLVMTQELARKGLRAPASLWRMVESERAAS